MEQPTIRILVSLIANDGESYSSKSFITRVHDYFADVQANFTGRMLSVLYGVEERVTGEYRRGESIANIVTKDRGLLHDLIELTAFHHVNKRIHTYLPKDPKTIHHARWVPVFIEGDGVDKIPGKWPPESVAKYPTACRACKFADTQRVPDPLPVLWAAMKSKNHEIYRAGNGIWIVCKRVFDLLRETVPDEFASGDVQVIDGRAKAGEWYWIRPSHATGYHGRQEIEETCAGCCRPKVIRWDTNVCGEFLTNFGDPAWNMARVGDYGFAYDDNNRATPWEQSTVVSGGLFAVLWHAGVKGLVWPEDGPYFSLRPDQPTLEDEPRMLGSDPIKTLRKKPSSRGKK